MNEQAVILVNEHDEPVGTMGKMEVHVKGLLHRAFSVFIFDAHGHMLLQQRAAQKYHGAHLWTNACCSHPYPGEETSAAAYRRLREELGITTQLKEIFSFTYKAAVENNLTEHEYDHVFAGEYNGAVPYNKDEVADYCYKSMEEIKEALLQQPSHFTTWFKLAFPTIETWWQQQYLQTTV
jgi:isopentenyl-diphosphate Delta-isomerase